MEGGLSEAWQVHCSLLETLCKGLGDGDNCSAQDRNDLVSRVRTVAGLLMHTSSGEDADLRNAAVDVVIAHSHVPPYTQVCDGDLKTLKTQTVDQLASVGKESKQAAQLTTKLHIGSFTDKSFLLLLRGFVRTAAKAIQDNAAAEPVYGMLATFLSATYRGVKYAGSETLLNEIVVAHREIVKKGMSDQFKQHHAALLDLLLQCPFAKYSLEPITNTDEPSKPIAPVTTDNAAGKPSDTTRAQAAVSNKTSSSLEQPVTEKPMKNSVLSATSASFEPKGLYVPLPTTKLPAKVVEEAADAKAVATNDVLIQQNNEPTHTVPDPQGVEDSGALSDESERENENTDKEYDASADDDGDDDDDERDSDEDTSEYKMESAAHPGKETLTDGHIDTKDLPAIPDSQAQSLSEVPVSYDSADPNLSGIDSFAEDVFETAENSPMGSPIPIRNSDIKSLPEAVHDAKISEKKINESSGSQGSRKLKQEAFLLPKETVQPPNEPLGGLQEKSTASTDLQLKNPWTLWVIPSAFWMTKITNERYAAAIQPVGDTFSTVQGFWNLMQAHVPPPHTWKHDDSMYHLFRETIKPLYETPELAAGGSFDIEPPKGDVDGFEMIWANVLLGLIGGMMDKVVSGDEITGVVWQRKPRVFAQLTIWTKSARMSSSTMRAVQYYLKQQLPGLPISLGKFKTFKK